MRVLYLISNYRQQFIFRKKQFFPCFAVKTSNRKNSNMAAQCVIAINLTPAVFIRAVTCNRKQNLCKINDLYGLCCAFAAVGTFCTVFMKRCGRYVLRFQGCHFQAIYDACRVNFTEMTGCLCEMLLTFALPV